MEISGQVVAILASTSGTSSNGNDWIKHAFVIETEGQYPKKIKFDFFSKDPNSKLAFGEGDNVTVAFNLESREYNSKWYSNINAYKVTTEGQRASQDKPAKAKEKPPVSDDGLWNSPTPKQEKPPVVDTSDDLPF